MPGFVWKNNESFTAGLVISNYSASDLQTSVAWRLQDEDGQCVAEGVTDSVTAAQGRVTAAGRIRADLRRDLPRCTSDAAAGTGTDAG